MPEKRITIISAIHGKVTPDRKVSEPDIYWILGKWLERHPEVEAQQGRIRIERGNWTTEEGLKTEVVTASITTGDDIAGYDHAQDSDLYEYYMAEERYWQAS